MARDENNIAAGEGAAEKGVLRSLLAARSRSDSGAGRAPQLPQPIKPTPARAAATAIGRAADRLYHLGVQPISVTPGALTLPELPELLPSPALLAVLQGPGDLVGVMALCPEAVSSLIEIQTLGRVTARATEKRRPTRSDAMICADFVNALMEELANELEGVEGFDGVSGYRYASYLDDPRPLSLMMEDKPYRSLRYQVRLGGTETRDATIFLAMPQPATQSSKARQEGGAEPIAPANKDSTTNKAGIGSAPEENKPNDQSRTASSVASLGLAVQSAPIEIVGVLCRRRMTLGELRGLSAGKLMHLPRLSLSEARIELPDGQLLAVGKFGEAEGCHAVRLRDPAQSVAAGPSQRPAQARPLSLKDPAGEIVHGRSTAEARSADEPPIDDLSGPDAFRSDQVKSVDADEASVSKAVGNG